MNNNASNYLANQIFNTDLTSIDYINRFNRTPVVKMESVSQHTFWVILFSRIIASRITKKTDYEFVLMCVDAATVHDLFDETITGDILFDFKHNPFNGDKVRQLIDEYVEHQSKEIYPKDSGNIMNNHLNQSFYKEDEKLGNMIKSVVKVADWLACLKYEYQEFCFGNNAFYKILTKSLNKYNKSVSKLKTNSVEFFNTFGRDEVDIEFFEELENLSYGNFKNS